MISLLSRLRDRRRGTECSVRVRPGVRAFTVIELMVAVSLMALIVFALYSMFNQTQKALRSNIQQVDVLEAGRAAVEMMARELEGIVASGVPGTINLSCRLVNRPEDPTDNSSRPFLPPPIIQIDVNSPNGTPIRTNVLQEYFFLTSFTNAWIGTGYTVLEATEGVGTLYRYTFLTNTFARDSNVLATAFFNPRQSALYRVADGIIHLRLKAFDELGRPLEPGWTNSYQNLPSVSYSSEPTLLSNIRVTQFTFRSNALPAYLELELGVVEPETLVQYNILRQSPPGTAARFLRERPNKVHIFRQRIPIRTAYQ